LFTTSDKKSEVNLLASCNYILNRGSKTSSLRARQAGAAI